MRHNRLRGLREFLFRSRHFVIFNAERATLFDMALPEQLQAINQITEALGSEERRTLLYLCGALDPDDSVSGMREMLTRKVMQHDEGGHLFLRELMVKLRRFDILRRVFKSSKEEVERTRPHTPLLPGFRVLMADLSDDMTDEDVSSVKFLFGNRLPRERMEKAKCFLDVIAELEKLDMVSSDSVNLVEECLSEIGRMDLAKKVTAYKMSAGTSVQHSFQQQTERFPCRPPPASPCNNLLQTRPRQSFHSGNIPVSAYRTQSPEHCPDYYKFNTNPRGVCVIIDCVGNDGEMLEQTFKALHFKVILHRWLSVAEILATLTETLKMKEIQDGDSFSCCIISRGTESKIFGTDPHALGLDLDRVKRFFTATRCRALVGKPKLFFVQRYSISGYQPPAWREHRDEDLETDGYTERPRCDAIPEDGDVFWSHCSIDECQLERGQHNSVYLKALADALYKCQRRKTHILDVQTEVNGAIFDHNRRNPDANYHIDVKHTLRKELYLH